jgi:hypothetical protein
MKWQYYWTDSLRFSGRGLPVMSRCCRIANQGTKSHTRCYSRRIDSRKSSYTRSSVGGPLHQPIKRNQLPGRAAACRSSRIRSDSTAAYSCSVAATLARLFFRSCSAVNLRPQTAQRQYVDAPKTIPGPSWSARLVRTNSLSHSGHCRWIIVSASWL